MDIKCDFPVRESFNPNYTESKTLPTHDSEKGVSPDNELSDSCVESLTEDNSNVLEDSTTLMDESSYRDDNDLKCDPNITNNPTVLLNQTNNNNIVNVKSSTEEVNKIPDTTGKIITEQELRNNNNQSNMTDSLQSESNDRIDLEDGIFYDCMDLDKSQPESDSSLPELINKNHTSTSSSEEDRLDLDKLDTMDFSSCNWLYPIEPGTSPTTRQILDEWFTFPKLNLSITNNSSSQSLLASLSSPSDIENSRLEDNDEITKNQKNQLLSVHHFSSSPLSTPDKSINQQKAPQKASRLLVPGAAHNAADASTANPNIIEAHNNTAGAPINTVGAPHNISKTIGGPRRIAATGVNNVAHHSTGVHYPPTNGNSFGIVGSGSTRSGIVAPHTTIPIGGTIGAPHKMNHFGATVIAPQNTKLNGLSQEASQQVGGTIGAPRITQIVRLGGQAEPASQMTVTQKICFNKSKPLLEKLVEPSRPASDTRQIRPPGTVTKTSLVIPAAIVKRVTAGPPLSVDQLDPSRIRQNLLRGDQVRRHTIIDVVPLTTTGVIVPGTEVGPATAPATRRRIARPTSLVKPSSHYPSNNNNNTIRRSSHDNNDKCCLSPSDNAKVIGIPQGAIQKPSVGPPIPSHNVPTMTTAVAMTPLTTVVTTDRHDDKESWPPAVILQQQPQQLNRTFDRDQFRVLKSFTNTVSNDNGPSNSGSDASTDTLRSSSDSENNNSHPLPLTTVKNTAISGIAVHNNVSGLHRKLALLPNPSENEPGIYQLARKEEEDLKKHVRSSMMIRQQQQSQPLTQQPSSRSVLTKVSSVRPRGIPTLRK